MDEETEKEEVKKIEVRPKNFGERKAPLEFNPDVEAFGKQRMSPSGKTPFAERASTTPPEEGEASEKESPSVASVDSPSFRAARTSKGIKLPREFTPATFFTALLISAILSGALCFAIGRHLGRAKAKAVATEEISVDLEQPSKQHSQALETALENLSQGLVPEAKNSLVSLVQEKVPISSLALMAANAALLDGDAATAERCIRLSLDRNESISDALMLQAIIEAKLATDPQHKPMGTPKVRIEGLLEQAITADASNPRPFFELATLRRFEKRNAEALELLNSASNRLGQSDSIMSVNLAIELVKMEQMDDAALRQWTPPGNDPQSLLCAAYAAMRLGDTPRAAELFKRAREITPPRTFAQLLKDPAFIPWRKDPLLEAFFPKQKTN